MGNGENLGKDGGVWGSFRVFRGTIRLLWWHVGTQEWVWGRALAHSQPRCAQDPRYQTGHQRIDRHLGQQGLQGRY